MRTLLGVLVLAPTLALAQPADPPSSAAPGWSIGAGVSTGYLLSFTGGIGLLAGYSYAVTPASVPAVSASLERAVGSETWFFFGFSAAAQRERYEPPPSAVSSSATLTDRDTAAGAVELGLRGVVTPASAPVTVSYLASVEGGLAHSTSTVNFVGVGNRDERTDAWSAALNVGLAVERTLGDRLAVRVATPLVRVSYAHSKARIDSGAGPEDTTGSVAGASLVLAPRLELRVYF